jgi:hypothetical protein
MRLTDGMGDWCRRRVMLERNIESNYHLKTFTVGTDNRQYLRAVIFRSRRRRREPAWNKSKQVKLSYSA